MLIVVSIAILTESASTTRKPRARKAPLQRNLAQPSSSSKRVPSSSSVRRPSSVQQSPSKRAPSSAATTNDSPSSVRRNPASLVPSQDLGFEATQVDRSRLKEDMAALGLAFNPENNNLDVMGAFDTAVKPAQRPAASAPRPNQQMPNPYNDYEDMLFDDYDQPLQDNKLLAESSSSGRYLKSEV